MTPWLTTTEIADARLPGLPRTRQGMDKLADKECWSRARTVGGDPLARRRKGKGGGWEYALQVLPTEAVIAWTSREEPSAPSNENSASWQWFDRLPEKKKAEAHRRLAVIDAVEIAQKTGTRKNAAVVLVVSARRVAGEKLSAATVYNWFSAIAGVATGDRLPALAPRHTGAPGDRADCNEQAWNMIKSDYLRYAGPSFTSCYDRARAAAIENGWELPPEQTLRRRLKKEVPPEVITFARRGAEALTRMHAVNPRDRSGFHALEAVNADFHRIDVFVDWPGYEKPVRPQVGVVQDLYSNKIVAYRVDLTPNAHTVRLMFKDCFEDFGIPSFVYLDNGREFAAKSVTGGAKTRYRFKIRDEDPHGMLVALGCEVHWTKPYSGQSKPIERAFREWADRIAKHPAFDGAYVGNSPMAKPEDYGSRAVPLEDFLKVLANGVAQYNAREGRQTLTANGRSFDETFAESYAQSPIRRAGAEQLRLALMHSELRPAEKETGAITILGNRYWCGAMVRVAGKKVSVRFDPDDLHAGVEIYEADGRHLCHAPVLEALGYADADAAQKVASAKSAWNRRARAAAAAHKQYTAAQVAAMTPDVPDADPLPERKVTRLVVNGSNPAPAPADGDQSEFESNFTAAVLKFAKKNAETD